ncbi:hypothetical protein GM661_00435 [Iocasia frigidifontis]|uniref:Uncharacterized protein n=1 Tax=Iocasia fonsfrigidae TaxID=2682810 RepID=A0A8A7K5U7_9FIRM|nr:hypothetical protein [Iocasia fonsfrigidae]QTL96540.1 hypothetical protein GM661_00435 [Iocasia fonsfrigidae]
MKDVLLRKKDIDSKLPPGFELEKDVIVNYWPGINPNSLQAVAFVNKDGKRRISEDDSRLVIEILQDITGYRWRKDNVSNFVIFLEDEEIPVRKVQMKLF